LGGAALFSAAIKATFSSPVLAAGFDFHHELNSMFACIYIPDFPVQASLLPEPAEVRTALNRSPIALLDGPANLPRVFATNSTARRAGIRTGMTRLQAEICAGIELRKRSLAEEESAHAALLDCAAAFSPRVESTAPGVAILDLAGTEKLMGRHNTRQTSVWPSAVRIITAKAAAAGLNVRIAIAANPDTAFLAARGFSENAIIPAGDEARRLAPLPVKTLPLSPEMLATLDSWGIRTFQALAALPAVAVAERLGQKGLYVQQLTRGAIIRPLLTAESNAEFAASFEFDDPVETLESIFFILNRLLQDLCSRLLSAAQAASELRLTAGLNVRQLHSTKRGVPHPTRFSLGGDFCRVSPRIREDRNGAQEGEQFEHTWKLPVPTQDNNLLFSLIRLHLEQTTFSAPVRSLRLEAIPVKPRLAQGNLFAPPSPEPEQLEITLERIRGVVGTKDADHADCVGSPHLLDTHKPGSFALQRFSTIPDTHSPASKGSPSHPERSRLIREANQPAESKLRRSRGVGAARRNPERSRGSLTPSPSLKSEGAEFSSLSAAPLIALRIFRPALETEVELDGRKPHLVRLWNRHRRVLAASGPWTTSGNWWNAAAWTREEWDVVLQTPAGPGFYRIYRDRLRRQWFVEGVFD
jgi:protein ImuB